MLLRLLALALLLSAIGLVQAQQALPPEGTQVLKSSQSAIAAPESAWLDLRQSDSAHSKMQAAPAWVESGFLFVRRIAARKIREKCLPTSPEPA